MDSSSEGIKHWMEITRIATSLESGIWRKLFLYKNGRDPTPFEMLFINLPGEAIGRATSVLASVIAIPTIGAGPYVDESRTERDFEMFSPAIQLLARRMLEQYAPVCLNNPVDWALLFVCANSIATIAHECGVKPTDYIENASYHSLLRLPFTNDPEPD